MSTNEVDKMIAEWEASADAQIAAALVAGGSTGATMEAIEVEELRRELEKEHPSASEEEVNEMIVALVSDLSRVRGSC